MNDITMIALGMDWFDTTTPEKQRAGFKELLRHAVESEWVRVRSPVHVAMLCVEGEMQGEDVSVDQLQDPYLTTCGESICEVNE